MRCQVFVYSTVTFTDHKISHGATKVKILLIYKPAVDVCKIYLVQSLF